MFGKSLILSAIAGALALVSGGQAVENASLNVGGSNRTMMVYAPKNIEKDRPLIIQMHGMNQDAGFQHDAAKWEEIADTARFVVVFPNGEGRAWDISGDKDVNFLKAIINDMGSKYGIDKKRVYVSGFSMGGMMSYHAANKMGDMIAAIAPVSGYPFGAGANSKRMMPVIHTHGTTDDVVGYSGGADYAKKWANYEGCGTYEKIAKYPANRPSTAATLEKWTGCKDGSEVRLITIAGKGHWYSMDLASVNTSDEIWNFCKRFSLDGAASEEPAKPAFVEPTKRDSIYNGGFEEEDHAWTLQNHGDASSVGSVKDGKYSLQISAVGTQPYTVQLIQHNIVLEKDQWYEVSFDASATAARTLEVNVEQHVDPWASYLSETQTFDIGTDAKTYSFKFLMKASSDEDSRLSFNAGASTVGITLDNVKLKKVETPETAEPEDSSEDPTEGIPTEESPSVETPADAETPAENVHPEKEIMALRGTLALTATSAQVYRIYSLKGLFLGMVTAMNFEEMKIFARNVIPSSGVYIVRSSWGSGLGLRRMILTK